MRDMIYAGLNNLDVDPSLSTTNINSDSLEDNLDTLSLYSVKDCDSAKLLDDCDTDSQPLLQELGLPSAPSAPKEVEPGGRSGSGKKGRGLQNALQAPFVDCSLCGKVFSSTSSLSKHYVTHSQERKHICKICSKAFKRQDHLSGHMLTHQKTKPFICIEEGCNKSYSDHRSLRRHYEMHHGLRLLKDEEACESTPPPHDSHTQAGQGGLRAAESLAVHPESPAGPNHSLLPNRDLLRCIVSSLVGPKLPSAPSSSAGPSETDSRGAFQPSSSTVYGQISCAPTCSATAVRETPGEQAMKDMYPCRKTLPSSSMYTIINTGNLSILGPSESHANLPDRPSLAERDFPIEAGALEYWSNSGMPRFPLFRGQKFPTPTQQPSSSVQWARNTPPVGAKAKGHGLYVAQLSSAGHEASQGIMGPSHAFDPVRPTFECPDVLPFPPASLKAHGEVPGEARLRCFEETFSPAARLSDAPKHSLLQKGEATPLFRQLFMKSKESSLSQDQLQVQSHLFQRITKSQHIVSHTKVLAPSKEAEEAGAKAVPRGFQPPADLARPAVPPMENEGPPPTPFQADFSPDLKKDGHQPPLPSFHSPALPSVTASGASHAKHSRPSKRCLECKEFPSPNQYEHTPGNHTYGKPRELESDSPLAGKKEKAKACAKDSGSKGHSRSGRPRRKEKPKFDIASMASPSQVAMASFSLPSTSFESVSRAKPKLTIFNRIQSDEYCF
ncbi:PREDICTED: zinc finger protein 541 [Thamnophis sirtalis]|uniref:Zinc finger protein 541 n=1 Tax=Thamnophis sirtalis TaxID=35019 RepID=A0A6I9Y2K9_9SAUR|nr:PREDICTED: zinc finger protein 541 [Thamnophis sirtalis]